MTNKEKELEQKVKIEKWLLITSIIVIVLMLITGMTIYWNWWMTDRKIKFMSKFIQEKASRNVLKWSKYWELEDDWLKMFALLMTESNGKRKLKSNKNCRGYFQLARRTDLYLRERLKDIISNCDIYSTEYNISGGILHFKNLMLYHTDGDWWLAMEIYNTGSYNYKAKKKRAPAHMKRFGINHTYYLMRWKKYSSFWNLFKKED